MLRRRLDPLDVDLFGKHKPTNEDELFFDDWQDRNAILFPDGRHCLDDPSDGHALHDDLVVRQRLVDGHEALGGPSYDANERRAKALADPKPFLVQRQRRRRIAFRTVVAQRSRVRYGLVGVLETAPVFCPLGLVTTPCAAPLGGGALIGVGLAFDDEPNAALPPGSELEGFTPWAEPVCGTGVWARALDANEPPIAIRLANATTVEPTIFIFGMFFAWLHIRIDVRVGPTNE